MAASGMAILSSHNGVRMPALAQRAQKALAHVLAKSHAQSRELDHRVLCLALSRMIANDDDRCFLTSTYVESITGVRHQTAVDCIGRLLSLGVLEDITGTSAAEDLRARTKVWKNARCVRLWNDEDRTQTESVQDRTQTADEPRPDTELVTSLVTYVVVSSNSYSYAREEDFRRVIQTMAADSPVWNRSALGPRSMRLYSMLTEATKPVTLAEVRETFGLGRHTARSLLDGLRDHGLAVQDHHGHWLPGKTSPEIHSKALEDLPSPSYQEDEKVAQRSTQGQEEASLIDLVQCRRCDAPVIEGDPCGFCGDGVPEILTAGDSPPRYRFGHRDGNDIATDTHTGRMWMLFPHIDAVHEIDPRSGNGIGKMLKSSHPDYPKELTR